MLVYLTIYPTNEQTICTTNKEKRKKKTVTYSESVDFLGVMKFFWVWLRCEDFSWSGLGCGVAVL